MNKTVRLASLFFCALMFAGVLRAQDVHAIAEREVVRRQNGIGKGEAALVQAKVAMEAKILRARMMLIASPAIFCRTGQRRAEGMRKPCADFARAA